MPGSGTRTFLEPDHYEASLRQAQIEILIALSSKFKARLTWAELHDLQVLRCEEDFPRVAYVCLGSDCRETGGRLPYCAGAVRADADGRSDLNPAFRAGSSGRCAVHRRAPGVLEMGRRCRVTSFGPCKRQSHPRPRRRPPDRPLVILQPRGGVP
jgi:hypothetical protein